MEFVTWQSSHLWTSGFDKLINSLCNKHVSALVKKCFPKFFYFTSGSLFAINWLISDKEKKKPVHSDFTSCKNAVMALDLRHLNQEF